MHPVTLVGVLAVAVLTVLQAPLPASGVCCKAPGAVASTYIESANFRGGGVGLRRNSCNDCTRPTPYCGRGQCNLFGCSCRGGCREGRCERRRRSVEGPDVPTYPNVSAILAAGDLNADGALSMPEARRLLLGDGVPVGLPAMAALRELDTNNDGKLTSEEIDLSG